ncbi:MAG: V-type ATPase subunit [Ruminococcus sp.]|nr:V-type ATPase subunit [Ruminococcus sp.]
MSTTKYANAVAAVKAMENMLLTRNELDQLINSEGKDEAEALLSSRSGGENADPEAVWAMLKESAPDSRELEILLYKNDFHNLKAALKAMISGKEAAGYFVKPTSLDLEQLPAALAEKNYNILPEHIRGAAQEAYEIIVRTSDGQLADSYIDAETLRRMQQDAEETGSEFMKEYARLTAVCADIKTAYRCSRMKKSKSFLETAVCGSRELDREELIKASLAGEESLLSYLDGAGFGELAKLLDGSAAAFEKRCDDMIMELAESARMMSFGCEPLAAYFIAAEAEQKNLRIIRVCKEFGADRETITERMRKLYV